METPRHNTQLGTPQDEETSQRADEWNRNYIEAKAEPVVARQPIFRKKVLITWALVTLAAYATVKLAGVAIKESFKQAAVYTTGVETTPDNREVIYVTPDNKFVITKNRQTGEITFKKVRGPGDLPGVRATNPSPALPPTPAKR
jgi:hypothetical protein